MNRKISIPNVFAERILHLIHLKNGSALLALMRLFILVIYFLSIPEHSGWTHYSHLLQLIQSPLFCFWLLAFLIEDSVFDWFLLHIWHTQWHSSELHQFFPCENHCNCYKKVASRLWFVLFTLTYFFLYIHSPLLLENKKLLWPLFSSAN